MIKELIEYASAVSSNLIAQQVASYILDIVMMALSFRARIFGECSTVDYPQAFSFFFFF